MNELTYRLTQDRKLLYSMLEKLAEVEDFVKTLVDIGKAAYEQGRQHQRGYLGILRSDYMLDSDNKIKIIELNTIACSIGPLCDNVAKLQRFMIEKYNVKEYNLDKIGDKTEVLPEICEGLMKAK